MESPRSAPKSFLSYQPPNDIRGSVGAPPHGLWPTPTTTHTSHTRLTLVVLAVVGAMGAPLMGGTL